MRTYPEKFESYPETVQYLYSMLPLFTRVGVSAYKADLKNTLELCEVLGNPHRNFKSIHIAGTNGKGSSSHMLASVLQCAGYKTGLYTSPHLRDFRERIRINGQMISEDYVIAFVNQQRAVIERIEPSFFELTVALSFQYFSDQQVDIAVIETGLGGRLDSTNVIDPVLSLITNIGYDHMNILGNTLPEIAVEKAGIIKKGVPVIISQKQRETSEVFSETAAREQSKLVFASEKWKIAPDLKSTDASSLKVLIDHQADSQPFSFNKLTMDLPGLYQVHNLAGVLSSIEQLIKIGFKIPDAAILEGLTNVRELTGLMGRWQVLQENPLVICDTGHNIDGIKEVLKNIQNTSFNKLHMVIGMVKDKDIHAVLDILPKEATYYFCEPDMPRAKPAEELMEEAVTIGLSGSFYPSVKDALQQAIRAAGANDLIFVGGSTFVVAEVV